MSLFRTLKSITTHPLNRRDKGRALVDFVRWQAGSRLVPGPIAINWVNGTRFFAGPGEKGLTQNIYCGLADFSDMAYLLHVLQPTDLFVDVGANVGSYTILACAAKGASGYCFEPVPATYGRLMENIALNGLADRVVVLNIGVSDAEGELSFTSDNNCTNHVVFGQHESGRLRKIQVRTLDSVLLRQSPSVMKIDVEGFETRVINGSREILGNPSLHSVIMELNGSGQRYGFDENEILRQMADYGFSTYQYEPVSRKIRPLHGKNNPSGNTLFLRGENEIKQKLTQAPVVHVRSRSF